MGQYYLRDAKGVLKATVSNKIAMKTMASVPGEFQEKSFNELGKVVKKQVYVMKADHVFDVALPDHSPFISVNLWVGDYLVAV